MTDWQEFVEAHGQVIGYDVGDGFFIPVPPGNARAIRIREEARARFGGLLGDLGTPVYGPNSGEGS